MGAQGYTPALFTDVAQHYRVPHRPGAIDTRVARYLAGAQRCAARGLTASVCRQLCKSRRQNVFSFAAGECHRESRSKLRPFRSCGSMGCCRKMTS